MPPLPMKALPIRSDASATVTMPEPMSILTDFWDCAIRHPDSAVNALAMHRPITVITAGLIDDARTISGLSPVARIASPSLVRRNTVSAAMTRATAITATASLYCPESSVPFSSSFAEVKTVCVLFIFSRAVLPINAILTEYSPVFTMMPDSRLLIPILVWRNAVTKPDSMPAPMAAGIARYGCPAIATTAPVTAPSV